MTRAARYAIALGLVVGTGLPASLAAQTFGKNPMRTNPEFANLQILASGQVDVIYYAPLDTLARLALPIADSCIHEMERIYDHRLEPNERVTVFLFGENDEYRQGWVLPGYLTPPSIGYTEPLKGNIGVSFDGDAGRLHELVCHEIAHRFQLSIRDESYADHPYDELRDRKRPYRFPPWVTEGDATFVSHGFNSISEMVVRYVVNSGEVSFSLSEMLASPRSILSYFLGSEFWRFAAGDWDSDLADELRERERGILSRLRLGDSLRVRFFKDQALYSNPGDAFEGIYGVDLREMDRAFDLYLHLRFGRDYTNTVDAVMFADRVVPNPDTWSEQPDLSGPRVVEVSPERADTVVDLFYTANPDGYPGIFTLTLPYGDETPGREAARDPALFDMCLRQLARDCEGYGIVAARANAPPDLAPPDGDFPAEEEVEPTDEERARRDRLERLRKEIDEEIERLSEADREIREEMNRSARASIAAGPRRIVKAGTEDCQDLDPRANRLEGYLDGTRRLLAYVCTDSRTQERTISVRDLDADERIERYALPDLASLSSPTWSPDGSAFAFAGISRSGTWDLYTIRRGDGTVTRLTTDAYADGAPDWSPDGRTIVFTSDRTPYGKPGSSATTSSNLFLLDVASGEITYLTSGRWTDLAPRWSPDGTRILFASDRGGAFDLYVADVDGRVERLTRISTGILSAEWWPDGESIVFTAYDGLAQIYRMDLPGLWIPPPDDGVPAGVEAQLADATRDGRLPDAPANGSDLASREAPVPGDRWTSTWTWEKELNDPLVRMASSKPLPSRFHLTLSGLGGAVGSNSGLAGLNLVYSTLDNSRLFYTTFNTAWFTGDTRIRTDIGKYQNLYAAAGYLNLNQQPFWGVSCYRQSGLFIDEVYRNVFGEDHLGCRLTTQHPLSAFRRWELRVGGEYSDQADLQSLDLPTFERLRSHKDDISYTRRAGLAMFGAAYVHDNALLVRGIYPVAGQRLRLDCGVDFDVGRLRADSYTCFGDGRLYARLGARSNLGFRAFGFYSDGFTSRRFTLDWRNYMTLYPSFGLYGQYGWVGNIFLAFPLIERLGIHTPAASVGLPAIRAALFADFGQAWLQGEDVGPVWSGVGIRATMPIGPLRLGVAWGHRFTIWGGDIDLPSDYRGNTWRFLIIGTP